MNRKLLHIAQGVCRKIWAEKGRKGAADKLRPSPEWQAPPFRVIPRSEASLALPLGELSPKVTERALQALLNGNSNQGEGCFSLSGGCAASSPKGRAKLRNDKSGNLSHSPGRIGKLASASLPCHCEERSVLGSPTGRAVTEGD